MNRRHALNPTKSPALTGGDDRPTTPCEDEWPLFWALIDTPRNEYMQKAARAICDTCPIQATCWDDNFEEEWVQALAGKLGTRQVSPNPCRLEGCERPVNAKGMCAMHYRRARRKAGHAA